MRLATNILCLLVALTCRVAAIHATERVTIVTLGHGTVAVDNATPAADDVVTITVSPDDGYAIAKSDITAEVTIDPGLAHAPATVTAPAVGYFLPLEGEQPGDTSHQASYTFTMPEQPLNVQVTARFTEQTVTGLSGTVAATAVTGVCYIDMSGRVGQQPFPGINIVVTTFADGSKTAMRRLVK